MKQVLAVIAVLVAGLAAFVATRPGTFHVERSISILGPPSAVYLKVADFHAWSAWSPWEKRDPAMRKTYTDDGYSWSGNREVGAGSMTFLERTPARIVIKLAFTAPFASQNVSTFTLTPKGDTTDVLWSMDGGGDDFTSKAVSTFMNMDKAIGPDCETGLKNLKDAIEDPRKPPIRPGP